MNTNDSKIIVALDFSSVREALVFVSRLDPSLCKLKVGKELFTRGGPMLVRNLVRRGYDVFLDLKFHDIPNTVAGAVRAAADMGVWMMNIHASGGPAMMIAARNALPQSGERPLLSAVTLLTSLNQDDLKVLGYPESTTSRQQVLLLTRLSVGCGMDGVVCSGQETSDVRVQSGTEFLITTPGIRSASDPVDDQKRTVLAGEAIHAGSNYLVIGRPVTQAIDPIAKLQAINTEIAVV